MKFSIQRRQRLHRWFKVNDHELDELADLIVAAQRVHDNLDEHNGFATCRADLKHELGKALEPFQDNP